jgi:hypothetical protein
MKHTQLKYSYIESVDSWNNPIAKNGFYDDCQFAEFTGCWDDKDDFYEVLFLSDGQSFCLDPNGNECEIPETDNWIEDDKTYIYYNEDTDEYFEQTTNGNFWAKITKPVLVNPF